MGSLVRCAASLFMFLLSSFCGVPVTAQDLRERDALCNEDGCYVLYFQRKFFLDAWRACREKGGNLATIKRQEEADTIANLFSSVDLRHSRTKLQVWIGLQRQPRQCMPSRPLRGFSWTTGDQDTQYTNWLKEDINNPCTVPRCVFMGYSTVPQEQKENLKWLEGPCSVNMDGYLCRYTYNGMCPALWNEGGGNAFYTTPFNLLSTVLTHLPFGSVATVPCPAGTKNEQSVLCMHRDDGTVGWSQESPLCSDPPVIKNWCGEDNSGCEHFCREAGDQYYCECSDGYQLADDEHTCEIADVCQEAPCEFECLPLSDGYRCACPEGYMLAPNERGCVDVDECLQSPCEQLCVNAPGTFECRCRDGYRLDEEGECLDVDECISNPCEQACENTAGSYICYCHMGFSISPEDPSRCQETDECQIPGTCEQMCVNYVGGFECYCEEGYELKADQFSCQKIEDGDGHPTVSAPFPWATHLPDPIWDPNDFQWTPEVSHTDWPRENDESLDWLTDPPNVPGSDIIWVTSAPQEELPFHLPTDNFDQAPEGDQVVFEEEEKETEPNRYQWADRGQSEVAALPNVPPTSTSITPTPDWYDDEEEDETTTSFSTPPISPVSEDAWNRLWFSSTPVGHKPGNTDPAVPVTHQNINPDSIKGVKEDGDVDHDTYFNYSDFPLQGVEVKDSGEDQGQLTTVQPNPSPSPQSHGTVGGEGAESGQDSSQGKQGGSWLLVGLLVPICIFVVVMVVLGIVYCARCSVQPQNKNATDCYHWISGAHDKQGAPNPSAGVKSHV